MYNSGQVCVCPDYILCHKDVLKPILERMKYYIKKLYYINYIYSCPNDPTDQMDRMVNNRHTERVIKLLEKEKGEVLAGGLSHVNVEEKYIPPTLIQSTFNSPFMEDEIFGPILLVIPINSIDEGIEYVRSKHRPLALYIYSEDKDVNDKIIHSTSSGGVTINHCLFHLSHPYLPFGGVGNSGTGRYLGKYSFEAFSHEYIYKYI